MGRGALRRGGGQGRGGAGPANFCVRTCCFCLQTVQPNSRLCAVQGGVCAADAQVGPLRCGAPCALPPTLIRRAAASASLPLPHSLHNQMRWSWCCECCSGLKKVPRARVVRVPKGKGKEGEFVVAAFLPAPREVSPHAGW